MSRPKFHSINAQNVATYGENFASKELNDIDGSLYMHRKFAIFVRNGYLGDAVRQGAIN